MTREDARLYRIAAKLIASSVLAMIVIGTFVLWANPPSAIERECVSKTALELRRCLWGSQWPEMN